MDFKNLLRMLIFISFAILVHKKGQRNMDCEILDTSKYTLPIPLNKIVHHHYGQIEFVCPFVKYELDYFKNTKDLANLYDCLVDEMALCQRLTRAEVDNRENILDVLNNSDVVKLVREVVSPYQDKGYEFAYDYTYMVVQGKKVGNTFTYSDAMGCLLI